MLLASSSGVILKGCFRDLSAKRSVLHHEIGHNIRFQHSWTWLPDPAVGPSDPFGPYFEGGFTSITDLSDFILPSGARHPFDIMGAGLFENIAYQVRAKRGQEMDTFVYLDYVSIFFSFFLSFSLSLLPCRGPRRCRASTSVARTGWAIRRSSSSPPRRTATRS